jgi:hypothetical protein
VNSNVRRHHGNEIVRLRQLSVLAQRRMSLVVLWLALPVLGLSALLFLDAKAGGWNVHGFAGLALLLLSVVAPVAAVAAMFALPLLLAQRPAADAPNRIPIVKAAIGTAAIYLVYSLAVAWNLWSTFRARSDA